jgi:hypothetical protein
LTFAQVLEASTFYIRRVEEHVLVRSVLDESESLVRQPFDLTFSHTLVPEKKSSTAALPDIIWSGRSTAHQKSNIPAPVWE